MTHRVAREVVLSMDSNLRPNAEEGREYVSTHGFSETLCLHLWRRVDRWRRNAGGGYPASPCLQDGEEKAQGAENCAQGPGS